VLSNVAALFVLNYVIISLVPQGTGYIERYVVPLSAFVLYSVAGICVYGILTYRYGPKHIDPETRCRKCGYILRGIPEPRCSE